MKLVRKSRIHYFARNRRSQSKLCSSRLDPAENADLHAAKAIRISELRQWSYDGTVKSIYLRLQGPTLGAAAN